MAGYTKWARQTIDSDIFTWKPAIWFKIWFFIVNQVNHADNKQFKRGEGFMTYGQIRERTKSTQGQVDKFMRWAKWSNMLSTRKTTRGMILKVLKYDIYQSDKIYKVDTKVDGVVETQSKHSRNTVDTINKNDKNDKNDNIITAQAVINVNKFFDLYHDTINPGITYGNKGQRKAVEFLVKEYGEEKAYQITKYAISIQGKDYSPVITTPYQLKEKLGDLQVYAKKQKSKNNSQERHIVL